MKKQRLSKIRYQEWFFFIWYMETGQKPCYTLDKEQYIAKQRFYKNLNRHLQYNSIYMQRWRYLQGEKP